MDILIAILLCSAIAYISGYLHADHSCKIRFEKELSDFNDILETSNTEYDNMLRNTRNTYETEIRELRTRNANLLDEISHVSGIDEITLPSFGTIYLDRTKHIRESMRLLNDED